MRFRRVEFQTTTTTSEPSTPIVRRVTCGFYEDRCYALSGNQKHERHSTRRKRIASLVIRGSTAARISAGVQKRNNYRWTRDNYVRPRDT